jgi:hypothetical protein
MHRRPENWTNSAVNLIRDRITTGELYHSAVEAVLESAFAVVKDAGVAELRALGGFTAVLRAALDEVIAARPELAQNQGSAMIELSPADVLRQALPGLRAELQQRVVSARTARWEHNSATASYTSFELRPLLKWLGSNEAYAWLPFDSWLSGGCLLLATALHRILPGSEIWWVVDQDNREQHAVLRYNNLFLDGDGVQSRAALLRKMEQEESVSEPSLVSSIGLPPRDTGISCPLDLVDELEVKLQSLLPSRKTAVVRRMCLAKWERYDLVAEAIALNTKYWNRELILDFPLVYRSMRRNHGLVKAIVGPRTIEILELAISDLFDMDPVQFRGILAHELIHVALFQRGIAHDVGDSRSHGLYFKAEIHRLAELGLSVPLSEEVKEMKTDVGQPFKAPVFVAVVDGRTMIPFRRIDDQATYDRFLRILSTSGRQRLELFQTTNPAVRELPIAQSLKSALHKRYKLLPLVYTALRPDLVSTVDLRTLA